MYIHQRADWPNFQWNAELVSNLLAQVRHEQGKLLGAMDSLGFKVKQQANLQILTQDVVTTSAIEGVNLDKDAVRSSLARRLGVEMAALKPSDRQIDGIVDVLLNATQHFSEPLSKERLFAWHASLFPSEWSGLQKIRVGAWRDISSGSMQVVSRKGNREIVHFEAPSAELLEEEMSAFLGWLNDGPEIDSVLKSGIAHFWFVTIHPFDDGNGRIARAIADMLLARSEGVALRFYSMSTQIRLQRNEYYEVLEQSQKATMEITRWLEWYLRCLQKALADAQVVQQSVLLKSRFWDRVSDIALNERQRKVLNSLLDGFEGKLTSSSWAKLTKCSQDTAHRDITELMEFGILQKDAAGGRSTSYSLISDSSE